MIIIRKMVLDDLFRGFLETLSYLKPTLLTGLDAIRIFHSRKKAGIITLVAVESKVVGTASIVIEEKYINKGGLCAHIEDVAVHKKCRGKGIGKALVKACLKYAKVKGCYKSVLVCNDSLIDFYKDIGFVAKDNHMRVDF